MRKRFVVLIFSMPILYSCSSVDKNPDQQNPSEEMEPKTIEHRDQEDIFIISHVFEADAGDLFRMWTDPDTYTNWMGPAGAEMSFLNADVRENGTALWQMLTPDGLTKYGQLHYKTINPPDQLSYVQNFCDRDGNFVKAPFSETYPDSLMLTADFNQQAERRVKMTVKWEIFGGATGAERQTFNEMKPYMVTGWGESFIKLEELLRSERAK